MAVGVDQDRESAIPGLVWIVKTRIFEGPSSLKYRGEPVFQIDLDSSSGFRVHSTREWSDSMKAAMERIRDSLNPVSVTHLPAKIEGEIVDENDRPVANVTVRIQRHEPYVDATDTSARKS